MQVKTSQGQSMQLQLNMRSMEPLGGSGGMPPQKINVIGLNLVTILCYN